MKSPEQFNPFHIGEAHDMWDVAAALRANGPATRLSNGFVFVSRYEEARRVLVDNQTFSAKGGFRESGHEVPMEDRNIGELDPPEHAPIRQLARSGAGGAGVAESLRPFVREQSEQLIDRLLGEGRGDLIAGYGLALTNLVIARLLGLPLEDSPQLAIWTERMVVAINQVDDAFTTKGRREAFPEFVDYIDDLIRARLSGDDVPQDAITRIVRSGVDEADLPTEIIRMILLNLLLGGTATTRDTIGHVLYEMLRRPDLHERLRSDRSLVPAAVEECLRLAPPVLFLLRLANEPTQMGDLAVAAGDRILVAIASANRDEEIYPEPDVFSLDREEPLPHLSFGYGPHLCVGAALSRMEVQEALSVFLDRVAPGDLALAPGFEMSYVPVSFLYGPMTVDVVKKESANGE